MMFGEQGAGGCWSMYLYGEGERLSLTCIPRQPPYNMCMGRGYNSLNKRANRSLEVPAALGIARKENIDSG
jgi:hypothetical protein